MNHKKHLPIVALAAAAILLVTIFIQSPKDVNGPGSTGDDQTAGDEAQQGRQNFNTIDPADWSETERAERYINESQGKPVGDADLGEKITYGIVEDPAEEGVFYFATYEWVGTRNADGEIEGTADRFIGVYRYESTGGNWERLYRRTEQASQEITESDNTYFVLGYDDGLILPTAVTDSLNFATCVDAWTGEVDTPDVAENVYVGDLERMDIAEPYNQWQPYEVPENISLTAHCL